MAYVSLPRRLVTLLMISTVMVSCSAEGLVPPAEVDGTTRVSAIRSSRQQGYSAPSGAVYQAERVGQSSDYPAAVSQPMPEPYASQDPLLQSPQGGQGYSTLDGQHQARMAASGQSMTSPSMPNQQVTSSQIAEGEGGVNMGQAAAGSGMGPGSLGYILGITKAYTTRVGEGPFPTELNDEIGQFLGEKGHEFGTVTGRKRRCGWFDAALVRQSVATNGITGIALTKLDVLDGLDELKICVGYKLDGQEIDHLPASQGAQARVEPIYITLEGWKESTVGARKWADLPAQAIKYVRQVEELIGAPVALLSTSPERDDTILVTDPFED